MKRTFGLGGFVVRLADEFPVLHKIELVACIQLPAAHDARKALQVVDVVLGAAHHLCWWNPLLAARTLRPIAPGAPTAPRTAHYCNSPFHTPKCVYLIQLNSTALA
jgi:hypothetical protein